MKSTIGMVLMALWVVSAPIYFVYLTFFAGFRYTWWNWIIVVPINAVLSAAWPVHLLVLQPLFG